MIFTGLEHVGFSVADMDVSVAWYTDFFDEGPVMRKVWDVEYVSRIVGYPGCKMECSFWTLPGGTVLELLKYLEPPTGFVDMESYNAGNGHLCLVTEDLAADFARLRGKAEFRDPEPVDIPWGPYAGGRACYLRDPDGISIELMQLPPGGAKFGG
jgi:catechol 2,3-dioxygenase-like lactoylglutathione lyase family enzyme